MVRSLRNTGRSAPYAALTPKLPGPAEEDPSKGVVEAIDMDSYRSEVRSTLSLVLAD